MNNAQKAAQRYNERLNEVNALIQDITDALISHEQSTNSKPHWAHVGDLGHVTEVLQEVKDFLPAPNFEPQS